MKRLIPSARPRALAVLLTAFVATGACQTTDIDIDNTNKNNNSSSCPTCPGPVPAPVVPTRLTLSPGADQTLVRRMNPATGVCEASLQFTLTVEPEGASREITHHMSSDGGGFFSFSNLLFRALHDTEAPLPTFIQIWVKSVVNGVVSNVVTMRVRDECPPGSPTPTPQPPAPPPTPGPGPTLDLWAVPASVQSGGSSDLNFTSANTLYCTWTDINLMVGTSGVRRVTNLTQTTTYPITCRGTNGTDISKSVTVTVTSPALSCSGMNATYSRTDGGAYTVRVNQTVGIRLDQQSGWPSHCEVFYGVDKPSTIKAVGAVPIEVCSGNSCNWYYGGKSGSVTGVWPGRGEVFSQVVIRENMGTSNERWVLASGANMRFSRMWDVIAATLEALGLKMPDTGQKWVEDSRVPGGKVCLTWECR